MLAGTAEVQPRTQLQQQAGIAWQQGPDFVLPCFEQQAGHQAVQYYTATTPTNPLVSAAIQGQHQQQQQQQQVAAVGPHMLHVGNHKHSDALEVPTAASGAATCQTGDSPAADILLGWHAQLQLQQDAAVQPAAWPALQPGQQQQQQACLPLGELQLLLPAVHAEYLSEMQLMLRACQLASTATKRSTASGSTLLMDPAARTQMQRQVLANCNDKHAAVSTAFRQAAHAVQAAAAAAGCSDCAQQLALGGMAGAGAASCAPAVGLHQAPSPVGMPHVWQCLQQLRSSYQQELVAATSALFAICRGFGQRYVLTPAASASIKAALAAAQQQHARVEQLWQDIVLAAGAA